MPVRAVLALLFCGVSLQAANFDFRRHYTKHEYRIPMRDGKKLFTAVYVPNDQTQSYPFLITRTPYSIAPYGENRFPKELGPSSDFASDGFIFVYQDVRGRYLSEGTWYEMTPHRDVKLSPGDVDESTDTYDTIDWLLKNIPHNNGKAGLYGISYAGFYAAAGLIDAHPALIAVSPQAPIADLYMGDDAFHNGAFFLAANFSFYATFPKLDNPVLPAKEHDFNYGTRDGYSFYLKMGNLVNADERYFHYTNPYWTDVIRHPTYDDFWKTRNLLPHLRKIKPATFVVGGWFDAEDLSGTLATYHAIDAHQSSSQHLIVMGPWSHGGWQRSDGDSLGNLNFLSRTAETFRSEMELPFFQHYLKGKQDPVLPQAYMFETGCNVWRRYSQWPPPAAVLTRLYLQAGRQLTFAAPTGVQKPDEYTSDPSRPVPYIEKAGTGMDKTYMDGDQRFVAGRSDVLTYETEPLASDITIAGPVSPTLHVSTTGTDSDFVVKLIDVYPDDYPQWKGSKTVLAGYQQLVRGEPFRGKFRYGFEQPVPFTPGKIEKIHFAMPDINHRFLRGHRIMVQVQSSWFPLVDRNPQTFTEIPKAKPADFQTAVERIYHSASEPSFLEFNVLAGQPACENGLSTNVR